MSYVNTALGRLFVEEVGEGSPILLWHSLLSDRSMWRYQVRELARDHRLLLVDGFGHGQSEPASRPFSVEDCAGAALAVLDAYQHERAIVLGLSWGGMTAMRMALRAPSRVRALGLLDTSAEAEEPLQRIRYRAMAALFRRYGPLRPMQQQVLKTLFGSKALRERPELGLELVERLKRLDREGLYLAIRAITDRGSVLHRLPRLRTPTLVIVGAEDRATRSIHSERIARAIPGARLEYIEGAGHLSTLEAPEELNRLLRRFLDGLPKE